MKKEQPSAFWVNSGEIIAIAHRGGDAAGIDKENTLPAFKAAQSLGYKYLETDVIRSSDGRVVAIHGSRNKLDSLFKKRRVPRPKLQEMSYQNILDKVNIGGEEAPLLQELLDISPQMKFFIDAKTDEVVEPLAKVLINSKALDRICVDSFSYQRLQRLLELLKPHRATAGLNIGRGLRLTNKNLDLVKAGRAQNIEAVHLHHSHVSKPMIDLLHSQGLKVLVWTANTKLSMGNAIKCGADGIISDRIALLKEVITSKESQL